MRKLRLSGREKEKKRRRRRRKKGKREEEEGRKEEEKKKKIRYGNYMCMDTSFNPCLCKDLYGYLMGLCLGLVFFPICWIGILPNLTYFQFVSHLWLCWSPRGCLVFFLNTNNAFFLGSEMNRSTSWSTGRSFGWMQ